MTNQIIFILIAVLLTAMVLVWILPTFFVRRPSTQNARAENIAAARERLDDVRRRLAQGDLSPSLANEYEQEIAALLLQDAKQEDAPTITPARRDWLGVGVVVAMVVVMTPLLYVFFGTPQALAPPPTMEEMTAKLARRLAVAPQDAQALAWLGRILAAQGQYAEAATYYARAREVMGNTPDLLAAQINALMLSDAPDDDHIDSLVQLALTTAPNAPMIRWLAGLRAEENNQPHEAMTQWQQALALLPADSPQRAQLLQIMADLRRTLDAPMAAGVTVVVLLGDAMTAPSSGALFVFAKTADESVAMPLAAVRRGVAEFPVTVVLDDRAAMAAATMSDFSSYHIIARISRQGTASAADDDLWGRVVEVARGARVTVIIENQGRVK